MSGKFTIQQMLWATLVFGFVAMVMTAAYRGNIVATGVLIAPLFMTITFGVLTTRPAWRLTIESNKPSLRMCSNRYPKIIAK